MFRNDLFALNAFSSGAVAVRVEGQNVNCVRNLLEKIIIIGIKKNRSSGTPIITPNVNDIKELFSMGSNYVSIDYTGRGLQPIEISMLTEFPGIIMCDIHSIKNAKLAEEMGACAITTAMSGYVEEPLCKKFDPPDLDLVEKCAKALKIPVIAEGRYWTLDQVREAFNRGAHSVCIGGAITRPDIITEKFVEGCADLCI